jgi:hypothetical protein
MAKHEAGGKDAGGKIGNQNPNKRGRDADPTQREIVPHTGQPIDDGKHSDTNPNRNK